jgi:GxxExxY protein
MTLTDAEIEQLTEKIIGCGIEVHRIFGPGLIESIYQACMVIELRIAGLRVESGRCIPLEYKGHSICGELKLDLVVEEYIKHR